MQKVKVYSIEKSLELLPRIKKLLEREEILLARLRKLDAIFDREIVKTDDKEKLAMRVKRILRPMKDEHFENKVIIRSLVEQLNKFQN